jgi:hypothetical protein
MVRIKENNLLAQVLAHNKYCKCWPFLSLLYGLNHFLTIICYSEYYQLHFKLLDVSLTNEALSNSDSAAVTLKSIKIYAAILSLVQFVN